MKIEEKINMIGQILADIQFEIKTIRARQKELRDIITNPDNLNYVQIGQIKMAARTENQIREAIDKAVLKEIIENLRGVPYVEGYDFDKLTGYQIEAFILALDCLIEELGLEED